MSDNLEAAHLAALAVLAQLPEGSELFLGAPMATADYANLALGLGYCVGSGEAVYRGENHYRVTPAGRARYEARE
jgi:hypothetical protein